MENARTVAPAPIRRIDRGNGNFKAVAYREKMAALGARCARDLKKPQPANAQK